MSAHKPLGAIRPIELHTHHLLDQTNQLSKCTASLVSIIKTPIPPLRNFLWSQKSLPIGRIPPLADKSEKNHYQRILDLENTVLGPFLTSFSRVRLLLKVFDTLPLSSSRHLVSSRCGGGGKANGKLTRVHLSAGVLSGRHAHLIPYHLLHTATAIHINLISAFSLLRLLPVCVTFGGFA